MNSSDSANTNTTKYSEKLAVLTTAFCIWRALMLKHFWDIFKVGNSSGWLRKGLVSLIYNGVSLTLEIRLFLETSPVPSATEVSAADIASITSGMQKLRHYRRRNRTKFTQHQIRELEKAFEKTQYPDVLTREELGERLDISESRIQVSFTCLKVFWW